MPVAKPAPRLEVILRMSECHRASREEQSLLVEADAAQAQLGVKSQLPVLMIQGGEVPTPTRRGHGQSALTPSHGGKDTGQGEKEGRKTGYRVGGSARRGNHTEQRPQPQSACWAPGRTLIFCLDCVFLIRPKSGSPTSHLWSSLQAAVPGGKVSKCLGNPKRWQKGKHRVLLFTGYQLLRLCRLLR